MRTEYAVSTFDTGTGIGMAITTTYPDGVPCVRCDERPETDHEDGLCDPCRTIERDQE